MNKSAKTKYGIHPLLKERWSPRAFKEDIIEKEKLQRIFEAAQWSPSAMNEQPWQFMVGEKGDATYPKILAGLVDANKRWAQKAPVLIVAVAKKNYVYNDKNNFHYLYDTGQAVAHLTFQACAEGLFVHQMGGFKAEIIKTNFNINDEYEIASVIALGYIADPSILEEDLRIREMEERTRKDQSEIFFTEQFGNSWFKK